LTARREMKLALSVILDRLRADYVEINIHKTSAKAWKGYIDFECDVARPSKLTQKRRKAKKK